MFFGGVTHISIMIFPKPYHDPPAPTRFDNLTLQASALSAFRTLVVYGAGMLKSAQSLLMSLLVVTVTGMQWTDEYMRIYASQIGNCILLRTGICIVVSGVGGVG